MKKAILNIFLWLVMMSFSSQAFAHTLWVNLYESFAHPPGHAMVSLGWGHAVPMDDLLGSEAGSLQLAAFNLIDPADNKTELPMPVTKMGDVISTKSGITVQDGDLGVRKLGRTNMTMPGTYQVVAVSKDNYFTKYLDKKGKQKITPQSLDQIKDVQQVLLSAKFTSFAKTFFAVEKWTEPQPVGFDLELMPMTDLSRVHAGDVVPFQITFMGKPLSCGDNNTEYLTATSNTFGGPDGFFLSAYIINGKAQFRIPTAGQWVVNVYIKQDVSSEKNLSKLMKKCKTVYYSSTISFNVKP